jgi:hypothetical protein
MRKKIELPKQFPPPPAPSSSTPLQHTYKDKYLRGEEYTKQKESRVNIQFSNDHALDKENKSITLIGESLMALLIKYEARSKANNASYLKKEELRVDKFAFTSLSLIAFIAH